MERTQNTKHAFLKQEWIRKFENGFVYRILVTDFSQTEQKVKYHEALKLGYSEYQQELKTRGHYTKYNGTVT